MYDKILTPESFCQLFTASDFENIGVFAGGTVNWLQLENSNDPATDKTKPLLLLLYWENVAFQLIFGYYKKQELLCV